MMLSKKIMNLALMGVLSLSTFSALAGNLKALLTINQEDGKVWQQDMSGLLNLDAQNNFSLIQGGGAQSYYQNGSFVNTLDAANPDYWQWKADTTGAGSWNWHTAETTTGASAASASDPWMSTLKLTNTGGHGDPDLFYSFSATNNTSLNQSYSFVIGEEISPTINTANTVYADISGSLSARSGFVPTISPVSGSTTIQKFELSSDNGLTFINSGANVGQTASGSGNFGTFSSQVAGPTGQTWNYMQIKTNFTLSAKSAAGVSGFASIEAVPEPESYTLFLSGLGLMGFMARRRKAV